MILSPEYAVVLFLLGVVPVIEKVILRTVRADTYIVIAVLFAAALCLAYLGTRHRRAVAEDISVLNANPTVYLLVAACAIAVFIVGNYAHLSLIRANNAYMVAAMVSCHPVITAVIGYAVFGEKVSACHMLGIIMIVSGATVLTAVP